jgi:hypothetical protein
MQRTIRAANQADVKWIERLLIVGTSEGHFSPTVGMQAAALLSTTLSDGGFNMLKLRNGKSTPVFMSAKLTVADLDGQPASFVLTLEDSKEVEIHLAATVKEFRRNGCFNALSNAVVAEHSKTKRVFARCYKKSSWAKAALAAIGFIVRTTGDPVELEFKAR